MAEAGIDTQSDFCPRHKTKEIEFYCLDCSVAVCGSCVILDHASHSKTDLSVVDEELRGKLNSVKAQLEGKIDEANKCCESLTNQISDIKNQTKIACGNVDQHVQRVCEGVNKHGRDIKCKMNKICDDESNKLQRLHGDMTKFKSWLQPSVKYINDVLNGKSTVPVVDALTNGQILTEDSRSTNFDIPPVKYVHYTMVDIDVTTLRQLLGKVETIKMESPTWTSSFSLKQIVKTDEYYDGDDVMIEGMPWCISVQHHTDTSGLGCYLTLRRSEDKAVQFVKASFTLKLLNINNVSKSIVREYTDTFLAGSGQGWKKHIEWKELVDVKEGFINKNKTFSVQASVKINKIKRY